MPSSASSICSCRRSGSRGETSATRRSSTARSLRRSGRATGVYARQRCRPGEIAVRCGVYGDMRRKRCTRPGIPHPCSVDRRSAPPLNAAVDVDDGATTTPCRAADPAAQAPAGAQSRPPRRSYRVQATPERTSKMSIAFPGESAEYRAARDRLLEQEIELRRATEAVAAARRALPPGGEVPEDYVFQREGTDGAPTDVRLSELFAPDMDSLVIYSFMFPRDPGDERPGPQAGQTALLPLAEGPCPSCTALLDQLDGAAEHARQRINLAVVAKSPLPRIVTFAKERGWRRLRLLSSATTTYNRDYHAETAEGSQRPMLNVFHRDGETIRHVWGSELFYAPTDPGQDPRHVGTLEPLWNLFDLTPEGRPTDWDEQLSYPNSQ